MIASVFENENVRKIVILCVVCVMAGLIQYSATKAIRHVFERGNVPQASIFVNLIRVSVWFFAFLILLEPVFGVHPTAFIAALGITSIAISLGLQNTISNISSGLGLMLAHVIEVGDWIEVDGYQGIVTDITWRCTTMLTLIGDVIVIPNSVLNTTMLRKLSPFSSHTVTIPLIINPMSNMEEVEQEIRDIVEDAVAEWRDPKLPVDLIQRGYDTLGFKIDVRVPVRVLDCTFTVRSTIVKACAGKSWLAHL